MMEPIQRLLLYSLKRRSWKMAGAKGENATPLQVAEAREAHWKRVQYAYEELGWREQALQAQKTAELWARSARAERRAMGDML